MKTITSKDGTRIAFDQYGTGAPLILVGGAIQNRRMDAETARLADMLGQHFTVLHYDRRGRGDSGDTLPYAVEREIEDLDALIQEVGGSAYLFGMSSGGALVLETALRLGSKVQKLAVYEIPYNAEEKARQNWKAYTNQLNEFLSTNHRGDAAALFMSLVGMPADQLNGMRQSPAWPMFEAVAPTLAYDAAVMGEYSDVPTARVAKITVPALIMAGSATYPFMIETVSTLTKAMPHAESRILEGQTHAVQPEVIAPVLDEFFSN